MSNSLPAGSMIRFKRIAVLDIALRSVLPLVLFFSPLSSADVSTPSQHETQPPVVENTRLPAADQVVVAVVDTPYSASIEVSANPLAANLSGGPAVSGFRAEDALSLAASAAVWLVTICVLGLAAINCRKRPLRLLRSQPDRDR